MSYGPDPRPEIWQRQRLIIGIVDIVRRFGWRDARANHAIRCEVATTMLDRNVESFRQLSIEELVGQWNAWYGSEVISTALLERKKGERV